MEEKQGIPLLAQAVTYAATLLSGLEKNMKLGERDRLACARIRKMLEAAENVLYGRSPEPQTPNTP